MAEATEYLHELVFEHAPVGLVMTENRIIKTCNPMFAEMFGYAVSDLIDRSFAILYPSIEEFVRVRDVGVEPLKKWNRYSDERIMARRDGTLFWCRVRGHSFTRDDPLARCGVSPTCRNRGRCSALPHASGRSSCISAKAGPPRTSRGC